MFNRVFLMPNSRFEKMQFFFTLRGIEYLHSNKPLFSRALAVPQLMSAVLGAIITTDQSKCRYVIWPVYLQSMRVLLLCVNNTGLSAVRIYWYWSWFIANICFERNKPAAVAQNVLQLSLFEYISLFFYMFIWLTGFLSSAHTNPGGNCKAFYVPGSLTALSICNSC